MISLTLWDSLSLDGTISLNSVFHIKNVATRLFSNIKSLTATKSTYYLWISWLSRCVPWYRFQDFSGHVRHNKCRRRNNHILILKNTHCLSCNRNMPNTTDTKSQFINCLGCNMKVKISSMNTSLTSTFQIKMSSEGTIKLIA